MLPEKVATILSDPLKRERVVSLHDASDVLREAFSQTEACMNHYYEVSSLSLDQLFLESWNIHVYFVLSSLFFSKKLFIN